MNFHFQYLMMNQSVLIAMTYWTFSCKIIIDIFNMSFVSVELFRNLWKIIFVGISFTHTDIIERDIEINQDQIIININTIKT